MEVKEQQYPRSGGVQPASLLSRSMYTAVNFLCNGTVCFLQLCLAAKQVLRTGTIWSCLKQCQRRGCENTSSSDAHELQCKIDISTCSRPMHGHRPHELIFQEPLRNMNSAFTAQHFLLGSISGFLRETNETTSNICSRQRLVHKRKEKGNYDRTRTKKQVPGVASDERII